MSNKRTESVEPETKAEAVQAETYTAEELTKDYKVFGTHYAIVKIALQRSGKDRMTIDEARNIIETFKNREVK